MEPFIGEIMLFAGNFAPRGWALCNGQLLAINQNSALFSLLGTIYGGDGRTTFALPDLRGRVPVHQGTGPGLSTYFIGSRAGVERVTLAPTQLPAHSHALYASTVEATTSAPAANSTVLADTNTALYSSLPPSTSLAPPSIGNAGGGQPHENMMPFNTLHFCIALVGIYPSRN